MGNSGHVPLQLYSNSNSTIRNVELHSNSNSICLPKASLQLQLQLQAFFHSSTPTPTTPEKASTPTPIQLRFNSALRETEMPDNNAVVKFPFFLLRDRLTPISCSSDIYLSNFTSRTHIQISRSKLHLTNVNLANVSLFSRLRCGLMSRPLREKTRSAGADVAGTQSTLMAK